MIIDDLFSLHQSEELPDIGPAHIPVPLTSVLGRDRELGDLVAMLRRPDVRLVTVTGSGGVGKSRLAIEVAHRIRGHFTGGQYFISLHSLETPDLVAPVILEVLRRHCAPGATSIGDLAEAMGRSRVLLLLNAVERVVDARPDIIRILELLPNVTALVTSRIPLRVRGEHEYPVGPLPLPENGMSLDDLQQVPSVQLFLERARSVRPTFELNDGNSGDLVDVLHHLDGLPVAIELAALRSRLFALRVIRDRMGSLLDFLAGGPYDLPSRLQNMRSIIRWGYDLLSPEDQRTFRTLSVFEGAFSFDAASYVLRQEDGSKLTPGEVMDALAQLLDHSLIMAVPLVADESGYRLPVTTREFGRELLREMGEEQQARERELAFYHEAIESRVAGVYGPEQPVLLARLDFFSANLHTALKHAKEDHARLGNALRVASRLAEFWILREMVVEGAELLQYFLDHAQDITDRERAVAARQLGALYMEMCELDRARVCHQRSVQIFEQLGEPDGIAGAWHQLGVVSMMLGDLENARSYLTRAYEAHEDRDRDSIVAHTLMDIGILASHEGDDVRARELHEQSYRLYLHEKNRWGIVWNCVHLLHDALVTSQTDPDNDWFRMGMEFAEDINDRYGKARLQLVQGALLLRAGDTSRGFAELAAALPVIRGSESRLLMLESLPIVTEVCVRLQDDRLAAQVLGTISQMGPWEDRFAWYRGKRQARELVADLRRRLGEVEFARYTLLGVYQHPDQTIEAVEQLIEGEIEHPVETPATTVESAGAEELPKLTGRERQVLTLVAQGLSDKAIAEYLKISPRTAMTHVSNIMKKIQVHSRAAATDMGIRMGLVPPPRDGES